MKIVVIILIGLLVATLGGGAYFFLYEFKPVAAEYEKLVQGQPEFERTRKELSLLKAKEKQETGWIDGAVQALKKGLGAEIAAGKAEVAASGGRIVVNISDSILYTPLSVTFAKDSKPFLDSLAALLKEFKDKQIVVGNMTIAAPAQGRGRKKVPARDARTLASARSLELVKYLEKNGVAADALVSASYPAKAPEHGFKIKELKTIIVITVPPSASNDGTVPKQDTKAMPSTKPAATASTSAPASQMRSMPISTVPPKKAQ